ncbi:hypothetical protein [Paenibacillus donghaensis]|uniref:Uncharacterized protein n=1 Tax=Paenibacillus donghaensis TaxID=414771 RepID=A0A2Z2KD38_9BACL|nr:hypothetical protein [Paenibacillus donghaensis]ASA20893.1 hypothetical protein B9T62_08915 [Paenibacillus donghaensis]
MALSLLINLQSYVFRNDFSLGNMMPLVTILCFILYFSSLVRMSLVLSVLATISGFVIFGVVQTGLALLLFGSIESAQASLSHGYVLQTSSGIVIIVFSWLLYRLGYGFTFEMDRLRFRFEDITVILMILLFLISISSVLYYNKIYINILYFAATSMYLLYYAVRKDRSHD